MHYKEKKIFVIGKIPPPIGGVTIHVYRLLEHLRVNNIDFVFYNLNEFNLLKFISLLRRFEYAHIHTSSPLLRLFFALFCILTHTQGIITIHGNLNRFNRSKNFMDRLAVKLCAYPITINKYSYEIASEFNPNTKLLSAYLSPLKKEELAHKIVELLHYIKKNYKYVIATNAYAKTFDKNGEEIYGIDFLIHFFKSRQDCALVISDPSGDYFREYNSTLESLKNIKIIGIPHSFVGVLEYADAYIRYTTTDGDSLSIHEAIELGVSVIATDVVDRPDGVFLIKKNDWQSIREALLHIQKRKKIKKKIKKPELIKFYKNLL